MSGAETGRLAEGELCKLEAVHVMKRKGMPVNRLNESSFHPQAAVGAVEEELLFSAFCVSFGNT